MVVSMKKLKMALCHVLCVILLVTTALALPFVTGSAPSADAKAITQIPLNGSVSARFDKQAGYAENCHEYYVSLSAMSNMTLTISHEPYSVMQDFCQIIVRDSKGERFFYDSEIQSDGTVSNTVWREGLPYSRMSSTRYIFKDAPAGSYYISVNGAFSKEHLPYYGWEISASYTISVASEASRGKAGDPPATSTKAPSESLAAGAVGWSKVNGAWYLCNANGELLTGWQKSGGRWYYLSAQKSGAMVTGWQKSGGKWYYLSAQKSGAMVTGWQKISGTWYYFGGVSDGKMKTGWQKIGGKQYYFKASGAMVTGKQKINGKVYTFRSNGARAA